MVVFVIRKKIMDSPSLKRFHDKGLNRIDVVPYYISTQKMAAVDIYIDTGHSCDKMVFEDPQVLRDMAKAFTDAAEWLEMKEEADHNNRMFRDTNSQDKFNVYNPKDIDDPDKQNSFHYF